MNTNTAINLIATVGENPNFIAFMAHAGATQFVISHFGHSWPVVAGTVLLCILKEFWYDLKFEKDPPQKFSDSLLDFAGYVAGIVIGYLGFLF